jgi:hypothetical protein
MSVTQHWEYKSNSRYLASYMSQIKSSQFLLCLLYNSENKHNTQTAALCWSGALSSHSLNTAGWNRQTAYPTARRHSRGPKAQRCRFFCITVQWYNWGDNMFILEYGGFMSPSSPSESCAHIGFMHQIVNGLTEMVTEDECWIFVAHISRLWFIPFWAMTL